MPTFSLKAKYQVDNSLIMSADKFLNQYFFGIEQIVTNGKVLRNQDILFHIKSAQKEIEDRLGIKIIPQVVKEQQDFHRGSFNNWQHTKTGYPVKKPLKLEGFVGTVRQITYPQDWLTSKKTNEDSYFRTIFLVPNGATSDIQTNAILSTGIIPQIQYGMYTNIPNYWDVSYITGFDNIPYDILDAIGKYAAISLFHQLGDLILGAGIANQSISLDGLSQSIGTTSSATNAGYGARIEGYVKHLKNAIPNLEGKYRGIVMTILG